MALLEVKNLEVYYGVINALKGISLEVNEGEIVTLIGANGAGKTTTMNSIMGFIHPKAGEIIYNGQSIAGLPTHKIMRKGLTQVPEGRRIFAELNVYENLIMGSYTVKNKAQVKRDLDEIYTLFPRLAERKTQMAGMLSGGEQQMLAMGRALMSHPKLLMLDEPSMGLAPILVSQVFDMIKHLNETGTTILLVEQNAEKALAIADRAYVMETGAITLSGTGAELAASEKVREAYLGG
ncbi:MAG: ABC transporter ATP-binding protein [Ruminococcaceae bacterium]|nr:ABC transporter ATP-binding protein [Oscillospiraceae bacterium]